MNGEKRLPAVITPAQIRLTNRARAVARWRALDNRHSLSRNDAAAAYERTQLLAARAEVGALDCFA
ncbi:MAG TPA: hypothetical protein PKH09_05150 [Parvularculaceae bacterium]|nr:hypothetical protein [Parvularculaceae bacterium]